MITSTGSTVHYGAGGTRSLCGRTMYREARGAEGSGRLCKRCEKSAPAHAEFRERIGFDAPIVKPEPVPTDVKVTTKTGERITYAHVPNGDPERVELFIREAQRCGAFADIKAEPAIKAAPVEPVVNEYTIEITRLQVSYYAPADHSACEHDGSALDHSDCDHTGVSDTCDLTNNECDSVGGRSLDGNWREISPAETEVLADWAYYHVKGLGYLELSSYPVGAAVGPHGWLSANESDSYDSEIVTEITVRLTDGWTPEERALAFTHITNTK